MSSKKVTIEEQFEAAVSRKLTISEQAGIACGEAAAAAVSFTKETADEFRHGYAVTKIAYSLASKEAEEERERSKEKREEALVAFKSLL
jgi:hypothetical protein